MNILTQRSRTLRKNPTEAEKALWNRLNRRQLHGCKFRRQVPIGNYIADFVCFEKRLIIELDGGQHAESIEYDAQRTTFLQSAGFIVMRFWNNDISENIEGVLHEIAVALNAAT